MRLSVIVVCNGIKSGLIKIYGKKFSQQMDYDLMLYKKK